MAQIALAWVINNPAITLPIIGATKPQHLTDAIDALAIQLTNEEVSYLEETYKPQSVVGHG